MADVGNFAAGIFFQAELNQPDFLVLQLDFPFDSYDRGTLKPCRDRTVEILLAGDMNFADYLQLREQGDVDGLRKRFPVKRKGGVSSTS